ncbi:MAG: hypothetical protein COU10_01790 [Candidatus Harrisonbacteria bacterium CG10_big_fil_rev_8_21_14_0_10_45_28]|uniref:Bacterial sugar transferase domain-containing protein n=1 Tax=Candidatus Harrisonbacteria bacterium CG10_big_fil_rev_8_21_14_0_10_45_28 TaxID=1974586 RepID=A0A2H0UNG3_9BACT|nr:MAG: hypothetical protein COU10_01790 [Candidatus Harrisonbacteria bacterium CG10_big_fil_rev_8_21_14_0_10_45_28]
MDSITLRSRVKLAILFLGDVFFYYLALALTVYIRYGEINLSGPVFSAHFGAFSLGLVIWLFVFYIGGMYERVILRNVSVLNSRFFVLNVFGGLFLILLLYFVPNFGIAPKTNFFVFLAIFSTLGYCWRFAFGAALRSRAGTRTLKIILVGDNEAAHEIARFISENPSSGYEIAFWWRDGLSSENINSPEEFSRFLLSQGIFLVIAPSQLNHDSHALRLLYAGFLVGVEVVGLSDFYEKLFERVSLADIEDAWVLARLPKGARSYHAVKPLFSGVVAFIMLVILSPVFFLTAFLIKTTSRGPVFYKQIRTGQNEKEFLLIKFRSMYNDAEINADANAENPTWSTGASDARITPIGRLLRSTHIDELPQLINIINGQMGFIGPRPERPEFDRELTREIPYYELRYLLKPGVTGWAQINYRYGASVSDARQKLQYEVYYLKNRSLLLDLSILFKTIKRIFVNHS